MIESCRTYILQWNNMHVGKFKNTVQWKWFVIIWSFSLWHEEFEWDYLIIFPISDNQNLYYETDKTLADYIVEYTVNSSDFVQ